MYNYYRLRFKQDVEGLMRAIITGGTGAIGRELAQSLVQDGHEVVVLSRDPEGVREVLPGVKLVRWDGKTADGWGNLVDGADVIFNLAGANLSEGRWTAARKRVIVESRVNAGKAVVDAVRNAARKPRVLVQISGVGAYGVENPGICTEESHYGNDFLVDVTREWEASTEVVETMGVRRVITRTAAVLDIQSGALPKLMLPFELFIGGPLGNGKQWLSWVHIQDQVRALRFLAENEAAQGIYNISAEPIRNRELAGLIGKAMHRPAFIPVPAFALQLVLGEMSTMVLDGQRVSSSKLLSLGFKLLYPTAHQAINNLIYNKRKVEES